MFHLGLANNKAWTFWLIQEDTKFKTSNQTNNHEGQKFKKNQELVAETLFLDGSSLMPGSFGSVVPLLLWQDYTVNKKG